uniref:Secreted protein n=1 Tax=Panagrellus redivivus TaxID=6233 RepID=A0A7E4WDD1_PANRE
MSFIAVSRAIVIVLVCCVVLSQCLNITTSAVKMNKKLTKQMTNLNSSIKTILGAPFLTQLVKVAASQDQTIRDTMAAVYNIPLTGFLCLATNYKGILAQIQSTSFTVTNIISALGSKCFLYKSSFGNIQTSANAMLTKFTTTLPPVCSSLPQSFQKLIMGCVDFVGNWAGATAPTPALTTQFKSLVTQFTSISEADKNATINLMPFLKPYLFKKGKLAPVLAKTLNLLAPCVNVLAIQNSAGLSPKVTNLAKGLTTPKMPVIAKWFIKGVNKLPITATIKSDSTVTNMANSVSKYGGSYGPGLINTASIQNGIIAALAGKYNIVL